MTPPPEERITDAAEPRPGGRGGRRPAWRLWPEAGRARAAVFVVAFAGVVLVSTGVLPRRSRDAAGDVGWKGTPATAIFVKHGADVRPWNGKEPVAPGDLLRLAIQGAGFPHVSVFAAVPRAPGYERFYEGRLPSASVTPLPSAWEVDAHPRDEVLVVVLGDAAVEAASVDGLEAAGEGGRHWVRRYRLPKRAAAAAP